MTTSRTCALRAQAPVAHPTDPLQISILPDGVATSCARSNATDTANDWQRRAFLVAGLALAAVSLTVAGLSGWSRGASTPESVVWATAGAALALVSLSGLAVALASGGAKRALAATAWALGLLFTVVAALGSQYSGRELATRTDNAATGDRARLERAYASATASLASLPAARPSEVIQRELDALLADEELKGCHGWLPAKRLRAICADKVEPARSELATAQARERLQPVLSEATAALAKLPVTKPANSDAASVARYLGVLGLTVAADRLADLLNLLTVLAVEVCGAVALALGRPAAVIAGHGKHRAADTSPTVAVSVPEARRDGGLTLESMPRPRKPKGGLGNWRQAELRRAQVIESLKTGALEGRQVDIADSLGVPKTTLRRFVESDGRLKLSVGPAGSRLELVAG